MEKETSPSIRDIERIMVNASRLYYNNQIAYMNNAYDAGLSYINNEQVETSIDQLTTLYPELKEDLDKGFSAAFRLYKLQYKLYSKSENNKAYGQDPDYHPSQEQPEEPTRKPEDDDIVNSTKAAEAKTEAKITKALAVRAVQITTFRETEPKERIECKGQGMSVTVLKENIQKVLDNKSKYKQVEFNEAQHYLRYTYNYTNGEVRTTTIRWKGEL